MNRKINHKNGAFTKKGFIVKEKVAEREVLFHVL